jgi:hypothetical protein
MSWEKETKDKRNGTFEMETKDNGFVFTLLFDLSCSYITVLYV